MDQLGREFVKSDLAWIRSSDIRSPATQLQQMFTVFFFHIFFYSLLQWYLCGHAMSVSFDYVRPLLNSQVQSSFEQRASAPGVGFSMWTQKQREATRGSRSR